jgi:hypothetical protein
MTARLVGESHPPNTTLAGWEDVPVHTLFHAPVTLLVTIRNRTDQPLQYLSSSWERDYAVDVRGGEIKQDGTKILRRETLGGRPPLSLHGSRIYEAPSYGYSAAGFRRTIDELESGKSVVVRILVDQIYDLSVNGMYRISVRYLFPVSQVIMAESPKEYSQAFRSRLVIPELSAEAVSNPIYVRAFRDVVALVSDGVAEFESP